LLGVLAALLASIALGTLWAVFVRPAPHAETVVDGAFGTGGVSDAGGASVAGSASDAGGVYEAGRRMFTGMGRLRVRLAAGGGGAAVVTIVFPYDDTDRVFVEELAHSIGKFRSVTADYFESLPAASPLLTDEQTLKAALLSRYNSLLRLGRIDTLYFSEYMIID
jgi:hypothetical protein